MSLKGDYYLVSKNDIYQLLKDAKEKRIYIYHLREYDQYYFQFVCMHWQQQFVKKSLTYITHQYSIGYLHFFSLFFVHKYRVIGLLCGCLWFMLLNQLSYGCVIDGNYPSINAELKELCRYYSLSDIHFQIDDEDLKKIEEQIHLTLNQEIDYLDMYKEGHIYRLNYTKKIISNIKDISYTPLISTQDAIVDRIEISSGNVLVQMGQFVFKGQTLVTHEIVNTSDDISFVPVEGKIYAYVYHTFEANMNGTMNPDTFTYLYQEILGKVKNEIVEDGHIVDENVLQYQQKEGKIILRIQFTLYQNIAQKEFFNEE